MRKNYFGTGGEFILLNDDDTVTLYRQLFGSRTFAINDISALFFDEGKRLMNTIPVRNGQIQIKLVDGEVYFVFYHCEKQEDFKSLYTFLCEKIGQPAE